MIVKIILSKIINVAYKTYNTEKKKKIINQSKHLSMHEISSIHNMPYRTVRSIIQKNEPKY